MIVMAKEIERKFLVNDSWQPKEEGQRMAQGYLCTEPAHTVRVRVKGGRGYLTVKGRSEGIQREEFEYEIPLRDAEAMLQLCDGPLVEKVRYREKWGAFCWEIDVFSGANDGLCVAEIELPDDQAEFPRPSWLGREVSGEVQYYNSQLIKHPYSEWKKV